MKTKKMLDKIGVIPFVSGFIMIQDAYDYSKWHGVSTKGVRSWTEHFQKMVDEGQVGKSK